MLCTFVPQLKLKSTVLLGKRFMLQEQLLKHLGTFLHSVLSKEDREDSVWQSFHLKILKIPAE